MASFALTSFLIELTPGPNMTYLALVAASKGRRYGFSTVLGVTLGLAIIGFAAAIGVAALIQSSDLLYELLRWTGVLFLFYLAYEGWVGEADDNNGRSQGKGRYRDYFLRGLMTNLLNPKAAAFYVTVLPAFLPSDADLTGTITLTGIYVSVATLIHAAIVLLAGALAPILNDPVREQTARRVLSLLLAGVAIWFAVGSAR
jgi:threonine/homoserine/homoserine lactone efflux protein